MSGTQITQVFTTPFYAGAVSFSAPPPYTIALNDHVYAFDLAQYQQNGLAPFNASVVTSGEPNDNLFNSQGGWWRYRFNWNRGMGQPIADLDDNVIGARYDVSENLYPWETNALSLSNTIDYDSTQLTSSGTSIAPQLIFIDNHTIAYNGVDAYAYDSSGTKVNLNTGATDLFGTDSLHPVLRHVVWDGQNVWGVANNNGGTEAKLVKGEITSWATNGYTALAQYDLLDDGTYVLTSTFLKYVGNRLLLGSANKLYEVANDGTCDLIYTHSDYSFTWTTAFNVGSRLFVGGHSDTESFLYNMSSTSTGVLAVAAQATTFPTYEFLYGGFGYGGNAIVWSNRGIRFATITGDNSLTYGSLIETDKPVYAASAYNKYIWFDMERADGKLQVGRMSLEDFTETLTPAYSTEYVNTDYTDEISSMLYVQYSGQTSGQLFVVDDTGRVFRQSATSYATTGYFRSGDVYFGTAEPKSLGRARVRFDKLRANETVKVSLYNSETNELLATQTASLVNQEQIDLTPNGLEFTRAYVQIDLTGDGTTTPTVRQWNVQAYPISPPVRQWQVPLIIGQTVLLGSGEGVMVTYDPWTEFEYVRNLWRNRSILTYTEGGHSIRTRIDNFLVRPTKWTDDGDWLEITLTVQLLSVE